MRPNVLRRRPRGNCTAAWTGLQPLESRILFHAIYDSDHYDHHDPNGHYSTDLNVPLESVGDGTTAVSPSGYSATGVPIFHSLPGAKATLYLDFDAHFEATWASYRNISSPAYDIDGNPSSFSATERTNIQQIWARVAEDYAPFNIDVTTQQPSSFADGVAMRVVIGGSSYDWYKANVGGISYVDSFTNSYVNTAYVFPAQLGNGDPKYVAESVSHEAGHTFGLRHQSAWSGGTKTSEYNSGGNGWAPIMGNSFSQNLTTWYNGTSSTGAYQDDMAVISKSTNLFGYRADDYGNSTSYAAPMLASGTSISRQGVISQSSDKDFFYFDAGAGQATLNTNVCVVGPNLDVVMSLFNSGGQLVASANPSTTLGATITATLAAGRYFLSIASTGVYGRLGQYSISGNITAPGSTSTSSTSTTTTTTTTTTAPRVSVNYSGGTVADGQTNPIYIGSAKKGDSSPTCTFTVTNTGNAALNLGPPILPTGYTITNALVTTLNPGQSDTFTIALKTATAGTYTGTAKFSTNDPNHSTFDFAITGTVTQGYGTPTASQPVGAATPSATVTGASYQQGPDDDKHGMAKLTDRFDALLAARALHLNL